MVTLGFVRQRYHRLNHRPPINYQSRMSLASRILCQQRRTSPKLMLAPIAKSDFYLACLEFYIVFF
jgi:hypothetical protein